MAALVQSSSAGKDARDTRLNWSTIATSLQKTITNSLSVIGKLATGGVCVLTHRGTAQSPERRTARNRPRKALGGGADEDRAGLFFGRQRTQVTPRASL